MPSMFFVENVQTNKQTQDTTIAIFMLYLIVKNKARCAICAICAIS